MSLFLSCLADMRAVTGDFFHCAVQVDLISFTGPTFAGYDNRVAALRLVQKGLCDAALFDPSGAALLLPTIAVACRGP